MKFLTAKGERKNIKEFPLEIAKILREKEYKFCSASTCFIFGGKEDVAKIGKEYYSIFFEGKRVNNFKNLPI